MRPIVKIILKPVPFVILMTILFFVGIAVEKHIIAAAKVSNQTETPKH
jgi:hypothetical protein